MESEARIARPAERTFKVAVFGEARSGKSLLIDFLKSEKTSTASDFTLLNQPCSASDPLETMEESTSPPYVPTWGLKCHEVK